MTENDATQEQLLDGIEEALGKAINNHTPGGLITGWSVFVEYIDPASESMRHLTSTFGPSRQSMSTTLGQHKLALIYLTEEIRGA